MVSEALFQEVTYVVLGAGESRRFGEPKLKVRLAGRSVLWWALRPALTLGLRVVLVLPADQGLRENLLEALRRELSPALLRGLEVVTGGRTRQESSYRALQRVSTRYVLIHDAARPFVSDDLVKRVMSRLAVGDVEGVVPAVSAHETVRLVRGEEHVLYPRDKVLLAQTPQGFVTEAIRRAHQRALERGLEVTDDASLLEEMGYRVCLIDGDLVNLKLTYREMLPAFHGLAEWLSRQWALT